MKAIAVLCILCLLIVGTVSAATINAALITSANKPASVIAVNRLTAITFDSNVHGATVYLDDALVGSDEAHSKTPVTNNLVTTGNHTATFRLSGYKESVVPFYVEAGKPQTIYAQLQPSLIAIARQVKPINTIQQVQHPGIQAVAMSTPSTTVPSPTPTLLPCPTGYTCESWEKAQSDYGAVNFTQYGTLPCNYTTARAYSKDQVKEYCFRPNIKVVGRITLNTNIIEPVGAVRYPVGIVKPVPVLPVPVTHSPPVITHVAPIDSFIHTISSGFFGFFLPPSPPDVNPNLQVQKTITGGYIVAPVIDQGATIFIGEQGLDVTHALNEAYGSERDSILTATRIGWWDSTADLYTTRPLRTIDLGVNKRYASMTVTPSDFVGYTGNWYLLNAYGIAPASTNSMVFLVADPSVGRMLIGTANSAPVPISGQTVARGEIINFQIPTNMDNSRLGTHRGPFSEDDGFMDMRVQDPTGALLTSVEFSSGDHHQSGTLNLLQNCGYDALSGPDACAIPPNTWRGWDTGAKDSNGQYIYPAGTYTLWAESHLNNMYNYYRNGGQPYSGKTVSEKVTFTLIE